MDEEGNTVVTLAEFHARCSCNRGARPRPAAALTGGVRDEDAHPFFLDMQRGAQEAAAGAGIRLVMQAAGGDRRVEKQVQIIESAADRVRALIVTPSGSREIARCEANAPMSVVVVDTRVDPKAAADNSLKLESLSDRTISGANRGRASRQDDRRQARVAVLEDPRAQTGDSRLRGFRGLGAHPGMSIVASQPATRARPGFYCLQNMLQSPPETDALFACSDQWRSALEAIAAAKSGAFASWVRRARGCAEGDRRRTDGRVRQQRCPGHGAHRRGNAAKRLRGEIGRSEGAIALVPRVLRHADKDKTGTPNLL